jgi:hypothetical protein
VTESDDSLATLTSDLPAQDLPSPAPSRKTPVRWMVAIMGGELPAPA